MDFTSRNGKFHSKSSQNAIPVGSKILALPPSCLEFVPISSATPWAAEDPLFVVGTYDLQKEEQDGDQKQGEDEPENSVPKEQSRQGSLSLYSLKDDVLTELQTFATPSAILDLHFYPETAIFAVASSTGTITVFEIRPSAKSEGVSDLATASYNISQISSHQVLDSDTIITYFAWDPRSSRDNPRMAITSTDGGVRTLKFNPSFSNFELENDGDVLSQHDFEVWCCAFSESGDNLFSGGDDSKLIMSTLDFTQPPASRKLPFHNAGVTMILPIPKDSTSIDEAPLLLSGSYDDFIRVYQPPSPYVSKPKVLTELNIGEGGGGVWRLKFLENDLTSKPPHDTTSLNPKRQFLILATCMRVGCKVLEVKEKQNGEWAIEVLAHTSIHESMNYASDVLPLNGTEGSEDARRTIVSTSFYDRLLFVWKYDPSIGHVK